MSCFLHVHPFGASTDYLWSYLQRLNLSCRPSEIEDLMERLPMLYKIDLHGVGASIERRWKFIGYAGFNWINTWLFFSENRKSNLPPMFVPMERWAIAYGHECWKRPDAMVLIVRTKDRPYIYLIEGSSWEMEAHDAIVFVLRSEDHYDWRKSQILLDSPWEPTCCWKHCLCTCDWRKVIPHILEKSVWALYERKHGIL